MQLDWTTFILEIINFLVLLWILHRFLYRPILASLDARQQRIQNESARVEQLRQQAETLKLQYENQLADWAEEREANRHQLDAELQQARSKALDELRKSLADEAAKKQARDEAVIAAHETALIREAAGTAYQQAAQMLARLASPALTQTIVDMFLTDLAELPAEQLATLQKAVESLIGPSLVEVRSAHLLDDDTQQTICQALSTAATRPLAPTFVTDDSLIAGIRVVVGECQLHANLGDELAFFRRQNQHV